MRFSSFFVVAGLAAVGQAQQKLKVMFLGDSITEITCWRPQVWSQLAAANLTSSIQLVGSMNTIPGSCQKPAGFDARHEGHSGYQAYDVARNNIAGWVRSTTPDIVQFMLGTNDVNIGKRNQQAILDAYTSILGSLRAANPNVHVIIVKMIPTQWSDSTIEAVNTAIPGWASQRTTAQSPITVADASRAAGYTNAMLAGDRVHPNSQGDQFIAKQVGPVLIKVIKEKLGTA
ncbi:SGNH hydrolase-type esterase domain-containing protein [Immersiella caudata]|uniref:SGNH hydrolase-type esterase domain-containing protein n=1 Tax=Immersiella caudata TaxID=314043 RepID=A0AA40C7Z1_9PEZI|nr:SGNH hydrolase-type esterase domain-containing protein [Immersiella caudata]